MILIREVSVRLYGFTDEKHSKAWQLLCSQRDHSPVKFKKKKKRNYKLVYHQRIWPLAEGEERETNYSAF